MKTSVCILGGCVFVCVWAWQRKRVSQNVGLASTRQSTHTPVCQSNTMSHREVTEVTEAIKPLCPTALLYKLYDLTVLFYYILDYWWTLITFSCSILLYYYCIFAYCTPGMEKVAQWAGVMDHETGQEEKTQVGKSFIPAVAFAVILLLTPKMRIVWHPLSLSDSTDYIMYFLLLSQYQNSKKSLVKKVLQV